jgi:O-antigen ligase
MQRILQKIILGLGALAFLVPLLVFPQDYIFPFIVPKILFFRSIVLGMIFVYGLLLAYDFKSFAPKKTAILLAIGAFLLSWLLSTIFGVDTYQSLWNNHERMLGLFTLLHFGAYALILSSVLKTRADWRLLEHVALGVGALVMLIAVRQKIDPEWFLNKGSTRVSATLGNAIYLSGYGLFLLALGVWMYVDQWKTRVKYRALYLVVACLGFLGIFMGGTRGTLLGLFSGLGVAVVLILWQYRFVPRVRKITIGVVGGLTVLLCVLFSFRTTEFVSTLPSIGPLLNTKLSEGTASTRLMAWGVAVDAWKVRPIFGWGPNNYYYAFNEFYRPEFLRHGYAETWFDNAHNVVMNTLATQGIFGIVTYFSLFGAALFTIYKGVKKERFSFPLGVVFVAFTVGNFVHNMFVFENPASYLYFFFFLSLLIGLVHSSKDPTPVQSSRAFPWGVCVVLGLVMLLLLYSTNINPKKANQATLHTIQSLYSSPGTALALYREALLIPSPHVDDMRNDVGRVMAEIVPQLIQANQKELAKDMLTFAYAELEKNTALHPRDVRARIQLATMAQLYAQYFNDPTYMGKAEVLLQEAIPYSPRRQQLAFALAPVKVQLGKFEEAEGLLQAAVEADPVITESWIRLLWLYEATDQKEALQKTFTLAKERGINLGSMGIELQKKYSLE